VERERRNGRWFVIVLVSLMALVVGWAWYLLFVVGQKSS
jgi:predicted negative regulator of RcsB-dependent stress response